MNENHIFQQIEQLVNSGRNREEILLETCHFLQKTVPKYTWVGFYLVNGEELVLGPYVGKPSPHTRIKFDSGICGAAVREGETIVVDDVNSDPRYLACSLETKSEMVVPIWKDEKIVGEIDIDSNELAAFGGKDQELLENLAVLFSTLF
jgi:L-methionine (R)-S-oxide reductase